MLGLEVNLNCKTEASEIDFVTRCKVARRVFLKMIYIVTDSQRGGQFPVPVSARADGVSGGRGPEGRGSQSEGLVMSNERPSVTPVWPGQHVPRMCGCLYRGWGGPDGVCQVHDQWQLRPGPGGAQVRLKRTMVPLFHILIPGVVARLMWTWPPSPSAPGAPRARLSSSWLGTGHTPSCHGWVGHTTHDIRPHDPGFEQNISIAFNCKIFPPGGKCYQDGKHREVFT